MVGSQRGFDLISRTHQKRPIIGPEVCHAETQKIQSRVQAGSRRHGRAADGTAQMRSSWGYHPVSPNSPRCGGARQGGRRVASGSGAFASRWARIFSMTSLPTYHATMFEKLSQFDLHHRIAEEQDPALVFFTSTECGACRHIRIILTLVACRGGFIRSMWRLHLPPWRIPAPLPARRARSCWRCWANNLGLSFGVEH